MFRQILSPNDLTDIYGSPVEIPNEFGFNIRRRIEECHGKLSKNECGGIGNDCFVEVQQETERGVIRNKMMKLCDIRFGGEPINISQ